MTPVDPAVASLAAPFLFVVPGLVALALLRREHRASLRLDEALWLAIAISVALSSWVALVLAELGRFSLPRAAAVLAAASLASALRCRSWPLPRPTRASLPVLLVLLPAVLLQARPSEYIVGGRDPGAYIASMALIARTGAIVHADPTVTAIPPEDVELFYRHPEKPAYSWSRFMGFDLESPTTGRVVPQFFHLFPAFGAYLFAAMGLKGALATPPLLAILATVGVYLVFVRLFGPAAGLLGALLLSLNVVQVWFARYPVSENLSELLLFAGLLAVALGEEHRAAPWMAIAGFFFGLSLLVRIDSVLLALPLVLYVLLRVLPRGITRREVAALVLPFGLLAAHAIGHAFVFAPKYLEEVTTRPYWNYGWLWAVPLGLGAALVALAVGHREGVRGWLLPEADRWRSRLALAVVALALFAVLVRPVLSAWAGGDGNDPAHSVYARFGGVLAGALGTALPQALGYRRLAAHDAQAFVRLAWFVTPLGLALAVAGVVLVLRRWEPRRLLFLLLVLTFGGFYFYKIRVYNDYFFALRRFLPVVFPAICGFAAVVVVAGCDRGGWRRWTAGLAGAVLAASFVLQTWPLRTFVDWKGAVRYTDDISRRFGPDDVVIFEQAQSIHLLSLPLWAAHGVRILELARFNPDPARLAHLVDAWSRRYTNIYFVHTYRTDLCGLFLETVGDNSFGTWEWERGYVDAPRKPVPQALHFRISRVVPPLQLRVPPLPEVDVGGSDDLQMSGFFDKEGGGDHTYRWSGSCGSIYVPGARGAHAVALTTSVENRPSGLPPALVKVSLNGRPLGSFQAEPFWSEHVLALPDPLPPGPPVLRIDVPAWRPANADPASSDTRDLGVRLDKVRLLPRKP